MVGLNKVMIIGNIGTDPEMRYTPNGNPVLARRPVLVHVKVCTPG